MDEMVFDLAWFDPAQDLTESEEKILGCAMGGLNVFSLGLDEPQLDPERYRRGRVGRTVWTFKSEDAKGAFRRRLLDGWERREWLYRYDEAWLDKQIRDGRVAFEVVGGV